MEIAALAAEGREALLGRMWSEGHRVQVRVAKWYGTTKVVGDFHGDAVAVTYQRGMNEGAGNLVIPTEATLVDRDGGVLRGSFSDGSWWVAADDAGLTRHSWRKKARPSPGQSATAADLARWLRAGLPRTD